MGRPARSLEQHVLQGSFRSRRHHRLLAHEPLPAGWLAFASLQARYLAATSDPERSAIGLQFERSVHGAHAEAQARDSGLTGPGLDEQLHALGKPGSSAHLLEFFPAFLRYPAGPLHGQPFQLEPWQKAFLREFHRRDRSGQRLYKKALLGLPSGNGKSVLAAAHGVYQLVSTPDRPQVLLAAGSRDQARLNLDWARSMIDQGPLDEWITAASNRLDCPHRQGCMQALSSRGTLQHGHSPAAALLDELWTFTNKQQVETYTALAAAIHKRPDAHLLATSTAGTDHNSLLGRIYHQALGWDNLTVRAHGCLTIAKNPKARALVWWYAAPTDADPTNPKILRACNPASWINTSDLQQQLHDPGLDESDFRRVHLNQWPTDTSQRSPLQASAGGKPDASRSLSFEEIIQQIEARTNGS